MKVCIKCFEHKELKDYDKAGRNRDGHRTICKSCRLLYQQEYHKNNRESLKLKRKLYNQGNKQERSIKSKTRYENRSIDKRIYDSLRSSVYSPFYRFGFSIPDKLENIIGCTLMDFRIYIESHFCEGMGWENRKDWHIDHILPVSVASSCEDLIKLNHYTNLRPVWKSKNLSKNSKIPIEIMLEIMRHAA
jgi:hypothetical protein